jgi:hypothetical protein
LFSIIKLLIIFAWCAAVIYSIVTYSMLLREIDEQGRRDRRDPNRSPDQVNEREPEDQQDLEFRGTKVVAFSGLVCGIALMLTFMLMVVQRCCFYCCGHQEETLESTAFDETISSRAASVTTRGTSGETRAASRASRGTSEATRAASGATRAASGATRGASVETRGASAASVEV